MDSHAAGPIAGSIPVIDSHCHLEDDSFPIASGERAAALARARAAGVVHFVAVGSGGSLDNVDNAIALAVEQPDVSAAIGIHPHDAARMTDAIFEAIAQRARRSEVVAIGETGLDYHYDHSPREAQKAAFRRFVGLARAVKKPLTLHIRDAHADARALFVEEGAREVSGVVHCFTGDVEEARAWLDLGCHLSFSGILTFKKADPIRAAAAFAPLDRILVETDCPFLAPLPHRGKRNEPAWVTETLRVLAQVKGISVEQAGAATVSATRAAFRL